MDSNKIIQHIQENYKSYLWHKEELPTFDKITDKTNMKWDTCFVAETGGSRYKAIDYERYGTGSIYIIVSPNNRVKIHYYPKDGHFYDKEISYNLYDIINNYYPEQEKLKEEKVEKDRYILKQQYEKDIEKLLGINKENKDFTVEYNDPIDYSH